MSFFFGYCVIYPRKGVKDMGADGRKTFYFDYELDEIDRDTDNLIKLEEERQQRKIILIASESVSPKPVREALGSVFTNIYAEGYPSTRMGLDTIEGLLDHKHQLSYLRRYSDNKYYKGTEYVDFIESLAQKRAARLFATDNIPAEKIYVNVQPLSGAPGNNAVFTAFLKPGDTVLSMALNCGGHLSHGSEINRSGINFNIISYGVEAGEKKLNYDRIRRLAEEVKPKLIIAGYSAYPWDIDWKELRKIADKANPGCLLLADISHIAALIVAGILNNPLEYADVIMTTTHKALAGPRGAILLTTDPEKAELINRAVFPGEQGGPHVNNIAAQAVCFNIAASEEFTEYAKTVAANAKYFSELIEEMGLELAYGGTESHLFLIDLKCLGKKNGYYVTGELATRILDQCGITVNKNTISGDDNATHPTGIRIGTPWITQRGFTRDNIRLLANIIYKVLANIVPFHYVGQVDDVGRGKISLEVLIEAKKEVAELLREVDKKPTEYSSGYPHYMVPEMHGGRTVLYDIHVESGAVMADQHGWTVPSYGLNYENGTVLVDAGGNKIIRLRGDGERLRPFLQQIATGNMLLEVGESKRTFLLDGRAKVLDDILVHRVKDDRDGFDTYLLETNAMNGDTVLEWLRGLADGYIIFDEDDIYAKVEGPVVVEDLQTDKDYAVRKTCLLLRDDTGSGKQPGTIPGIGDLDVGQLGIFEIDGLEVMASREHEGDDNLLHLYVHPDNAPSLWKYLLNVPGMSPGGFDTIEEYRKKAGLPDYGTEITAIKIYNNDPGVFDLAKPYFVGGKTLLKNISITTDKKKWEWVPGESGLKRTPLYEEHVRLGGRIVPFVGWEMPVQYEGISEEHMTVRTTAGLFDVAHMGVLELSGTYAADFLDMMTSNYVRWIVPGETQYAYILGPSGDVLDDIFIYRLGRERFMMVVNAANADKIWNWVNILNSNSFCIDNMNPAVEMPHGVRIRDLKAQSSGKDMKIDLAFQGPEALNVLLELIDELYERELLCLEKAKFMEARLKGIEVVIARTGYTGETIGFEIFVHPDDAVALWRHLLEYGKEYGVKPTGLGARDSTRTEAGFPLYGHEIEGPLGVFPMENGYAQFLKLHKPFFIGRHKALEMAEGVKMDVARFRMNKPNVKMLHTGDPVSNRRGQCIGYVSSSVLVGDHQIGLAYIRIRDSRCGAKINIFPLPHGRKAPKELPRDQWKVGNKTIIPEEATIISRFPEEDEMLERARKYI